MTTSSNKHWLIISYFANIPGACQSEWIDDRIAGMHAAGLTTSLVSSFCGASHPMAKNLRCCSLSPSEVIYELSFVRDRMKTPAGRLAVKLAVALLWPIKLIEDNLLKIYGEGKWGWAPLATLLGLIMAMQRRPSIIFSTGGPASAHLAAYFVKKVFGVPWMVELQDPLVGENIGRHGFSRRALAVFETFLFKHADKIIFCTRTAVAEAEKRHGFPHKSVSIYPGSSVSPRSSPPAKGDTFTIRYMGSLYHTRNLDRTMVAIKKLYMKVPELQKALRIDVYGHMSPDIRQRIIAAGIKEIKCNALVPRQDAFLLSAKSDVLLLIQNTDFRSVSTIPFKTYDYMRLGVPTLGLLFRNAELKELLERHGHYVVEADEEDAIGEAILAMFRAWQEGTLAERVRPCDLTPRLAVAEMIRVAGDLMAGEAA